MIYNEQVMRDTVFNTPRYFPVYKDLSKRSRNFGADALEEIFKKYIPIDPALAQDYTERLHKTLVKEPSEEAVTNPVIRSIEVIIQLHGWRAFLVGLHQYCRNNMIKMRNIGLRNMAPAWEKAATTVESMPRNVQL